MRVDLCKSDADLKEIIGNVKAAEAELGPCVLAIIDTVSRALAGGDENSPSDMGHFVSNCDRLREDIGATVLDVHHVPKGGADPRGHSCLKNGSEVRMLAKKVAHKVFSLTLEHLKDGEAGGEVLFELESAVVGTNDDGEEVEGGLVIETDLRPAGRSGGSSKKPTERQTRVLQELRTIAATTKQWEFAVAEFRVEATEPLRGVSGAEAVSWGGNWSVVAGVARVADPSCWPRAPSPAATGADARRSVGASAAAAAGSSSPPPSGEPATGGVELAVGRSVPASPQ